jgi:hypothetical protein
MDQWTKYYGERYGTNKGKTRGAISSVSQPTGFICSGISEIDQMVGGLCIGQVTAFFGKSTLLSTLLHRICVNTFDMFHSPTIVLDAGNQLNPYVLARFARLQILSEYDMLRQVYLSRTCTVYQLNSLVHHHIEPLIQQVRPVTMILTGLFSLIASADLSNEDTTRLPEILMQKIKRITKKYQVATILIDKRYIDFLQVIFDSLIDTTIHVQDMRHCPRITVAQQNRQITVTSETFGQLCLQDFGMVI